MEYIYDTQSDSMKKVMLSLYLRASGAPEPASSNEYLYANLERSSVNILEILQESSVKISELSKDAIVELSSYRGYEILDVLLKFNIDFSTLDESHSSYALRNLKLYQMMKSKLNFTKLQEIGINFSKLGSTDQAYVLRNTEIDSMDQLKVICEDSSKLFQTDVLDLIKKFGPDSVSMLQEGGFNFLSLNLQGRRYFANRIDQDEFLALKKELVKEFIKSSIKPSIDLSHYFFKLFNIFEEAKVDILELKPHGLGKLLKELDPEFVQLFTKNGINCSNDESDEIQCTLDMPISTVNSDEAVLLTQTFEV